MTRKFTIVLTGGGTAGHVMPHIAMLPLYAENQWTVHYIGSRGIEQQLMAPLDLSFHTHRFGQAEAVFFRGRILLIFSRWLTLASSRGCCCSKLGRSWFLAKVAL